MKNYAKQMETLCEAISRTGDEYRDDDLANIESYLSSITAYLSTVVEFNIQKPLLLIRYEGEEFRDKFEQLDKARRRKHQAMTRSINHLNKLCVHYHLPKIFDVGELDPDSRDDRAIAAGLCYDFCTEIFVIDRCGKFLPTKEDGSFDVEQLDKSTVLW
jgi:hypothetical protein